MLTQMSGRSGRDDNTAYVYFVYSEDSLATYRSLFLSKKNGNNNNNNYANNNADAEDAVEDFKKLVDTLESDACIRQCINAHNDGTRIGDGTCLLIPGSAKCCRCNMHLNKVGVIAEFKIAPQSRHQIHSRPLVDTDVVAKCSNMLAELKYWLGSADRVASGPKPTICPSCFVMGNSDIVNHAKMNQAQKRIAGCSVGYNTCCNCTGEGHFAKACPNRLSLRAGSICFFCTLPLQRVQEIDFHTDKGSCTSGGKDLIIPVCFAIFFMKASPFRQQCFKEYFSDLELAGLTASKFAG
jgi:hypothetical protein